MSTESTVTFEPFGIAPNGEEIQLYTLEIPDVIKISVMNYGATLTHLFVQNREGMMEDIVLGFDDFEGYRSKEYLENYCYLGSTVGRIGGRIKGNQFKLEGVTYILNPNQGSTHLHGGKHGWDRKVWKAAPIKNENCIGVEFSLMSPEGEENYPGNIEFRVIYSIQSDGVLAIEYHGTTDKTTILNPTNHSYFNLSGDFSKDILNQKLQISAKHFLPIDENSFPTGELKLVENTPFNFLEGTELGRSLEQENIQLKYGNGIDHSFALDAEENCLSLYDPISGRVLDLSTTEPGVQVYTSNYLDGSIVGKGRIAYKKNAAICLETQHFPDSINQKDFPSVILSPEEVFFSKTTFKFSVR